MDLGPHTVLRSAGAGYFNVVILEFASGSQHDCTWFWSVLLPGEGATPHLFLQLCAFGDQKTSAPALEEVQGEMRMKAEKHAKQNVLRLSKQLWVT